LATPETSLQLDVDVNAYFATRVRGFEIRDADRVSGVVDLGVFTAPATNTEPGCKPRRNLSRDGV
jgi:hypothetical protein